MCIAKSDGQEASVNPSDIRFDTEKTGLGLDRLTKKSQVWISPSMNNTDMELCLHSP